MVGFKSDLMFEGKDKSYCQLGAIISQLGMTESAPPQTEDELPIKKYLDTSRHLFAKVKSFDFKQLFQGLIIFISIITAYYIVEITHQHATYFQRITKINLKQSKTLALLFFGLSLYLIFWNLVARFLKNRALRPPPKGDEYEQTPQPEPETPPTLAPLPNGQKYSHQIIYESLNRTIYLFLALVAIASHAYLNQTDNDRNHVEKQHCQAQSISND